MKLLRIDLYVDNRKMHFFPEFSYETGRHVAAVKPQSKLYKFGVKVLLVTLNLSKAITLPQLTTETLDYNKRTPQ